MRKIGVVGTFAAGAALALAPLASAGTDLNDVIFGDVQASQVGTLNFLFQGDAALAGVGTDVVDASAKAGAYDTINSSDLSTVAGDAKDPTSFDHLIYGVDPTQADLGSLGADNLLNGAQVQFDDAQDVLLYAALHNGDLASASDLLGSSTTIGDALTLGANGSASTVAEAFGAFVQQGMTDLGGFFDLG